MDNDISLHSLQQVGDLVARYTTAVCIKGDVGKQVLQRIYLRGHKTKISVGEVDQAISKVRDAVDPTTTLVKYSVVSKFSLILHMGVDAATDGKRQTRNDWRYAK